MIPPDPAPGCAICPRLVAYREDTRAKHPEWYNGAVPSFGDAEARLLVLGLAPGVRGAHRTGRPFTGDYAGDLLYATLTKFGFANGKFAADPADGLELHDCMVTNAVRCVPPQNKPVADEINHCNAYLAEELDQVPDGGVILALGQIAHKAVVRATSGRQKDHPFGHGLQTELARGIRLVDSYHCSRYNTQTRRLTPAMFDAVFSEIRAMLGS